MAKKENNDKNYQANKAWQERKCVANGLRNAFQRVWRIGQLLKRQEDGTFTEKNAKELERVSI